jgi:hypothetical protein
VSVKTSRQIPQQSTKETTMDASLRPDEDTFQNPSDMEAQLKLAFASSARAKTGGTATYDPLADFDRATATDTELADRFRNVSEQRAALYLIKPDCEAWTDDEWEITTATTLLQHETELREGIVRARKRGFRICPQVLRAEWNATIDWSAGLGMGGGDVSHMKRDMDRPETAEERRIREANPTIPVIKNVPQWWSEIGEARALREIRMFKVDPEEAKRKVLTDLGDTLTKGERELLSGVGHGMYKEEKRKEDNREKVQRHREKNKLGAEHYYVGDDCWPEAWTEEDIVHHLSPPDSGSEDGSQPQTRKDKDRDRKRAARAEAKKPIEGSNEEPKPQLAPLPYRQKLASIKASLTGLGYQDLANIETFLTIMTEGWKSSAWESIEQTLADWRDGVFDDAGGPAVAE